MTPEFRTLQEAVAGRFSVIRELGRGGMGVVFLARDVALERLVAIKLLPPTLAAQPEARQRFLREARTVAGLTHPHIVPIHLVEERAGLVFFVMAFVDGETLGERVRRTGALAAADAMRVIQEVAWALAHAHRGGVVHRDVKPDNILLDGATGRAMVTDFGIARALASGTPVDGSVAGTPQYVSPEVAQGSAGDAQSDLYALGVTAWVATTGRLPFEGTTAAALLLAHVNSPAPSLAAAAPRLPSRFAYAVDRCLRKAPADRWESADAFAAEVDAARARVVQAPSPVRAFLRECDTIGGEVATAAAASVVALSESLLMHLIDVVGAGSFDASLLKWIFGLIAVLTIGLAKARGLQVIGHARTMLRSGYGHDRIAPAQAIERALRAEEAPRAPDRASRRETWMLLAGTAAGTAGAFALAFSDASGLLNLVGAAGAVLLPTLSLRGLWKLGVHRGETLWDRMLRGPIGRAAFRLAGTGLAAVPPAGASALEGPEPTAIALGQAVRALYAGLPAETRRALPDVPDLLTALERNAMALRGGGDVPGEAGVAADAERAARFVAAVGAIETLRLDLLRLQAHAVPSAELTEQIERVREFGAEVDRRLAAEREVRGLLRQGGATET